MKQLDYKHPKALKIFSLTEMWERYGFYAIQSLLAIYLANHIGMDDNHTYQLVGTFTALAYMTPVAGGWLADILLGQKQAVLYGAFILLLSYLILSVTTNIIGLKIGLSLVAVGTGLLKPNISSLLGNLYSSGGYKRDAGFTFFYMGLALGIILGTIIPAKLHLIWGWHASFFSAAIGLCFALIIFSVGIYRYKVKDVVEEKPMLFLQIVKSLAIVIGLWVTCFVLLSLPKVALVFFILVVIVSVVIVCYTALQERGVQRSQTFAFLIFCIISLVFWSLYFQMFLSLTFFIERAVDSDLLGVYFAPSFYVTIQSIGLVILGPVLALLWTRFYFKQSIMDCWFKFSLSIVFMAIAYGLIDCIIYFTPKGELIWPVWLILAYLFVSIAELLLSPVGLSMVTKLVRKEVVGLMMGIFFVSLGVGGYLAGYIAQYANIPENIIQLSKVKDVYFSAFSIYIYFAFLALLFCILVLPLVWKLAKNQNKEDAIE